MSMEFYGEFLPEATTWFRLPEYVKAILEPKLDNDAVELFGYNSEGTPVKIERSQLGGSESVTVNSTANGLVGVQNGANKVFTVSNSSYVPNSLLVFVSGYPVSKGQGLAETLPGTGIFTLDAAPESFDIIIVQYSKFI